MRCFTASSSASCGAAGEGKRGACSEICLSWIALLHGQPSALGGAARTLFVRGRQHSPAQQRSGSQEGTNETKTSPLQAMQAALITWATTPAALPPPASSSCCRAAADEARSAVTSS